MAELGLAGDSSPLPRRDRPSCGARTRKGEPCLASGGARQTTLSRTRWALNRTSNARGQGAHRGGAAQAVGRVVRDVVG
jgi:hypothetical protein